MLPTVGFSPPQLSNLQPTLTLLSHCRLGQRQSVILRSIGIEFVAETLRIPAGHETRASRAAVEAAHIGVCEVDPVSGEPIDMWRRYITAAVNAEIRVAKIVGNNQEDVRLPGLAVLRFGERRRRIGRP